MNDTTTIDNLIQEEINLYKQLNDSSITEKDKKIIIDKINNLSSTRSMLYNSLNDTYASYTNNLQLSRTTLDDQINSIKSTTPILEYIKQQNINLENEKQNKIRLTEINTYYTKRYKGYIKVLQSFAIVFFVILILSILQNRGYIPYILYILIIIFIIFISFYFISIDIVDLIYRSKYNFDEYDFYFNKYTAPEFNNDNTSSNTINDKFPKSETGIINNTINNNTTTTTTTTTTTDNSSSVLNKYNPYNLDTKFCPSGNDEECCLKQGLHFYKDYNRCLTPEVYNYYITNNYPKSADGGYGYYV